jgi:RNA polymerase sigma factor (sigma-70 family)
MATTPMSRVVGHLRHVALLQEADRLTDAQLLETFLVHREEAAFEALVRRHGPMILGVCRRILHDRHDAEDAFQATFLVLLRKAASIGKRELLVNWLYGVAHRTALKARKTTARRKVKERQVPDIAQNQVAKNDTIQDLLPLLDQELRRLPDKHRVPIILCDLEGMDRKKAALQLGLQEGTLSMRLHRARAVLAKRLAGHGTTLSGSAVALAISQNMASALVPPSLVVSTVKIGALVVAGKTGVAGAISAKVAALTDGVVKTMLLTKLKSMAVVFVVGMGAIGGGLLVQRTAGALAVDEVKQDAIPPKEAKAASELLAQKPNPRARPDTSTPLKDAVEALNEKTATGYFDMEWLRNPPLAKTQWPAPVTVDEVIAAIRGWDQKKYPVVDTTYRIFQQIAESKALPTGARLYFRDEWKHPGGQDKFEYRVWRIQLDVMTGKDTGYGFVIREQRLDRRIALLAAPGYSWLEKPSPIVTLPTGWFASRVIMIEKGDNEALTVTVGLPTQKGINDIRIVAFDVDGKRHVLRQVRPWGGVTSQFAMFRYRLDPKELPAEKVGFVGVELPMQRE